jgi:hypothetical protein
MEYDLEVAGGLFAFNMDGSWYVLLGAVASVVNKSTARIGQLLQEKTYLKQGSPPKIIATRETHSDNWPRLVNTYAAFTAKASSGGQRTRRKKAAPQNLALYPLELA